MNRPILPTNPTNLPPRRVAGWVVAVDPANRLIRVWDGRDAVDLIVPPGCDVRLNAEPIRLRLLEPGDPVEADVFDSAEGSIAATVVSPAPMKRS